MFRTAAGILVAVATAATPIAAQAADSVRASSAVVKKAGNVTPPVAFSRSSAELKDENSLLASPMLFVVVLLMAGAVGLGLKELLDEENGRSPR